MLRRFLIFLPLFVVCCLLFSSSTLAADNLIKDKFDAIKQGGNQESWLSSSFETQIILGVKSLAGEPQFNDDGSIKYGWIPGGVIGATNNFVGYLYRPPASGINYIANTFNNFLGVKSAYAQGVGFRGLEPLMLVWRSFRNAVYMLSSVIFIVIGIMIILRVKVSPQAVITIQNAIPNLITTLILVTFSYAIAGLLIDLSYFIQGVGVSLILYPSPAINSLLDTLQKAPIIGLLFSHIPRPDLNPDITFLFSLLAIPAIGTICLGLLIGYIIGGIISAPLGVSAPFSGVTQLIIGANLGSLTAAIILLILLIMIFFWVTKFTLGLFKCYATLIFKIVIAPLEIGLGAFPNMKMGFSTWIMDVIANLAVFVFSYLFLLLSNAIIIQILLGDVASTATNIFEIFTKGQFPPDIGLWVPNLLQSGSLPIPGTYIAVCAISLSTLLLLSKLPDMIPQFVFMLKPSPWGQAIGQSASDPIRIASTGFNAFDQFNKARRNYYEAEANRRRLASTPPTGGTPPTPPAPPIAPPPSGPTSTPSP